MLAAPRLACRASCVAQSTGGRNECLPVQPLHRPSRRSLLAAVVGGVAIAVADRARAAVIPPQPPIGECADCIGADNDALSACRLGVRGTVE